MGKFVADLGQALLNALAAQSTFNIFSFIFVSSNVYLIDSF